MALTYQFDFTNDPLSNRSFSVSPYTTNGTVAPNDDTLHSKATSAATSLIFAGKSLPEYGEFVQENMLHMLENFSSDEEPVHPIAGQLWNDTSSSPANLRVYDAVKDVISLDTTVGHGLNWFAIPKPSNATEQAAMLARLVTNFKVRIFNNSTGEQEEYLITSSASVSLADTTKVIFQVAPTPSSSRVGWYVGGWQFLMQQNSPLNNDLDANGFAIINLDDPSSPASQDAATASWVTAQIASAVSLISDINDLSDVVITSPSNNQILIYSGGNWINSSGSTIFLKLSGGTMTGGINMGSNAITNLPAYPGYPSSDYHVASKKYVDVQIAAVVAGAATKLSNLTDVAISGSPPSPVTDSVLMFNGTYWVDTFAGDSPFALKSGAIFTGDVTLSGSGHTDVPGLAATENYVDNQSTAAVATANAYTDSQIALIPPDTFISSGTYNENTQVLRLLYNLGGIIDIPNVGVNLPTNLLIHNIVDPQTVTSTTQGWIQNEQLFDDIVSYPNYPKVPVNEILTNLSLELGKLRSPKQRMVFATNGNGTVYSGDSSGGAITDQANPTGNLDYRYLVGHNKLQITVDGANYVASTAGYRAVTAMTAGSPSTPFKLWNSTRTGLDPTQSYSFNINVNGAGATVIGPITGVGKVETMGALVDSINEIADANYFDLTGSPADESYAFGAMLLDGKLYFISALPGTGSSIALTDVDLFSSLGTPAPGLLGSPLSPQVVSTGSPPVTNLTTGDFTIDDVTTAETNETNYPPTDYDFNEVGRPNSQSRLIEFVTIPTGGAIIEIVFGSEYSGNSDLTTI